MSWLDALRDRGNEALAAPVAKPAAAREAEPEIKRVLIQTRAPKGDYPGQIEFGYYSVADGILTMRDEGGKPTGKEHRLKPGDEALQIAGSFAREAIRKSRGETDFNRPLGYARGGWA